VPDRRLPSRIIKSAALHRNLSPITSITTAIQCFKVLDFFFLLMLNLCRELPALLSQLRLAEVQIGMHLLDWVRSSADCIDIYIQVMKLSNTTVSDDIAICKTTCPLLTRFVSLVFRK
jgi:hypothetical protein